MARPPARADRGMVTAELAVALPALVVVVAAALGGIAAMTAQVRCADAAATAARLAGRGEPAAVVAAATTAAAPGATLHLSWSAATVTATVTRRVRGPGALGRVGVTVSESSIAPREPQAAAPP